MNDQFKVRGMLDVYRLRDNNLELVYKHHNTISAGFQTNIQNLLTTGAALGVQAIGWGSWSVPAEEYIDGDYAGTTALGTKGALVQTKVGTNQCKFSGTFDFTSTKLINSFCIGNGYVGNADTPMFNALFAYQNSLIGTGNIQYDNGDKAIINWTLQIGV